MIVEWYCLFWGSDLLAGSPPVAASYALPNRDSTPAGTRPTGGSPNQVNYVLLHRHALHGPPGL